MKVVVWGVMPCSLVDGYNRFGGIWCLSALEYKINLEVAGISKIRYSSAKLHGVTSRNALISLVSVGHPRDYLGPDRSRCSLH